MEKKGLIIITLIILAIIVGGYFLFFAGDEPMLAPKDSEVSVRVGNANPSITDITPITVILTEGTNTPVTFQFTARDSNGADDLSDTEATATFSITGESDRVGTCSPISSASKTKTYECTVQMEYYSLADPSWTATVYTEDLHTTPVSATDSTTFGVGLLQAVDVATSINLGTVSPEATDTISSAVVLTNLGNAEAPTYPITITANDLVGDITPAELIPVTGNILVSTNTGTACSGIALQDATSIDLTGVALPKGATGNTADLYFCIKSIPEISVQDYIATWQIGI